ncbi:hypothetical protein [Streptomyces sp. LN245]|uniref:hypothetical protein n=1 Tax=Streptomyces sp. LN245 TaxID=3112975 RepID=UPI0037110AE4
MTQLPLDGIDWADIDPDDEDELDDLCNLGAELFYDGPPPRDMTTIQPPEEYL